MIMKTKKTTSMIAITFLAIMLLPMNAYASEILYTQSVNDGDQGTNGAGVQGFGADIGPSHILVGKTVNEITLELKKVNSPTGNMTIGVWKSGNSNPSSPDYIFGTQNIALLTTSFVSYTYTGSNTTGIVLAEDDVVGWYSGTADAVWGRDSTTNVDPNIVQAYVTSSPAWSRNGADTQDPAMILRGISPTTIAELEEQISILNSTIIQQTGQITGLQNNITSLNATIQNQQEDIDYLYTIWENIRDAIVNWLTNRP